MLLATVVTALVSAACGGAEQPAEASRADAIESALDDLRHAEPPIYFAGRRVAGLPLTHADGDPRRGSGFFVYGSCEIEDPDGSGPEGGSCSPPVQIQVFPFESRMWRRTVGCGMQGSLRGVPSARHDGLVLFTGESVVKIYAPDADADLAIVAALRDLGGTVGPGAPLPPPAPDVRRLAGRVCGIS